MNRFWFCTWYRTQSNARVFDGMYTQSRYYHATWHLTNKLSGTNAKTFPIQLILKIVSPGITGQIQMYIRIGRHIL